MRSCIFIKITITKMITLELKSKKREIFGKKVKSLRKNGLVPAIIYGGKNAGIPLIVELKDFKKVFKSAGETTLVQLFIDNSQVKNVLIYDVSHDPVTDEIKHVDFYEV